MDKEKIVEGLKPFWKSYWKIREDFVREVDKLEEEMSNTISLGYELEFFECEGECVGIGARDPSKREEFPLFQDSDLNDRL